MQVRPLGGTGISVSPICFGTLTVGPLQAGMPPQQGGDILAYAIQRGINFFDTAQLYGTYPHLRHAMRVSGRWDIVISTKTYAWTEQLAVDAVEQARAELGRDTIDIFMLHEQESIQTLRGHMQALETLLKYKQRGVIRAVGASMHHIAAVRGALALGLDVIHPILNIAGLGIVDGERAEMEQAVLAAHNAGIGVFSMKPLGGGNLFRQAGECLNYAFGLPFVDSVAIGMQSTKEVDANIEYFEKRTFSPESQRQLEQKQRRLHIDSWCEACGACVARCSQSALSLREYRTVCDHSRCVLCGYCAAVCPVFAIKVV